LAEKQGAGFVLYGLSGPVAVFGNAPEAFGGDKAAVADGHGFEDTGIDQFVRLGRADSELSNALAEWEKQGIVVRHLPTSFISSPQKDEAANGSYSTRLRENTDERS